MTKPKIIKIFKPIKELDAEISTIEYPNKEIDNPFFIIDYGLFESLGEQGGLYYTEFYKEMPTYERMISDIKEYYKYLKESYSATSLSLSGIEELQLAHLKKLVKEV